jgi:phosphatidylserine decarboxylase
MNFFSARLFVLLQYLLPKHLITGLVHRLARVRIAVVKNALIRGFVGVYKVDVSELDASVPDDYATFNDFFTRSLADGARVIDAARNIIVSPVDGTVSAAGTISKNRLLQAKGFDYSLLDLLASDIDDAQAFDNGEFATIYLAPHNYHRVHAPWNGRLTAARYVPGALFSVNDATVERLQDLFVRNERLILHFVTDAGPMSLIFVGALNVGSISTPWSGEIRPSRTGVVEELDLEHSGTSLNVSKGDLLGWFNMGSTIILLMASTACRLHKELKNGMVVTMGQSIATIRTLSP